MAAALTRARSVSAWRSSQSTAPYTGVDLLAKQADVVGRGAGRVHALGGVVEAVAARERVDGHDELLEQVVMFWR
jgi:hypothetical protein